MCGFLTGNDDFSTLATSCEESTHWKRLWCWEGLGAGGEGDHRGWDGLMASLTRWTWVSVNSRSWWWTGRPGVLRFMGLQRVGHDWATDLIWFMLHWLVFVCWTILEMVFRNKSHLVMVYCSFYFYGILFVGILLRILHHYSSWILVDRYLSRFPWWLRQ